ncbi:DEAD/DEAH box helicase [Parapedobacter tibetensis]|uniref:DEAD/DEAH box helicase n=1 Tax=Parapedobacter tibetensis TaxID=2972951 RepID=UPI00214D5BA5|nr:DEAD/DEAH box helicase [Parapedobacter tibetensis]
MNPIDTTKYHSFIFRDLTIGGLSESLIARHAANGGFANTHAINHVYAETITLEQATFTCQMDENSLATVHVLQEPDQLVVSSDVLGEPDRLNAAEAQVLSALLRKEDLRVFFDTGLRHQKLVKVAADYGVEHEPDLDRYFMLNFSDGRLAVAPRIPGMFPLTNEKLIALGKELGLGEYLASSMPPLEPEGTIVVVRRHKYYKYLTVELYGAGRTNAGKLKNPLTSLPPLDFIWTEHDAEEVKFYTAVAKFQQHAERKRTEADLSALRIIVQNACGYEFYMHDDAIAEKVSANTLIPINTAVLHNAIRLSISSTGPFHALDGAMLIGEKQHPLHALKLKFDYFLLVENTLYLVDNLMVLAVIELFREGQERLLIHASKYRDFRLNVLDKLEEHIQIDYLDVKPASPKQLKEAGFDVGPEKLIYLSDFGNHVMIIPVIRYGEAEIAIRTEKQVKAIDAKGSEFSVARNEVLEREFIALLLKQHPYLSEQLENQLYYFYLHKKHFLDEAWFLPAFDTWRTAGITVFGFNELSGNRLNPNPVNVDIKVISGLNWFNAVHQVRFGKKKATLKKIQAALRNKSKYVELDDGTLGILPQEWIDKFSKYFQAGEVIDEETIRIPKTNFETLTVLYEKAMLDESVVSEVQQYRDRLADFESISAVPVPEGLHTTLRPYQQQGLNWLNFLDDFNFGGCLADEMGLGKTIQIIAFILSQWSKTAHNTNLIVVPATLVFNWQHELAAFAPSLNVLTLYGPNRVKTTIDFGRYEVILTSYTTLLSDIRFLKKYDFNYIFLDESQNIKNPDSQRYKAVRLLQSRNRIAISGTPFENNSFDLYGQLSFACPGLLGNKRYFGDVYAKPIDQFKNQRRRLELQNKIKPFILRRTKEQVAADLPEKVSMVLYCEMGEEQRKIYDAYEREFRDYLSAISGDELDRSPMNVLRGLTRLRQICNSPALLPDGMLNTAVSAKIAMLKEQIADKAPHHKLLIFSQFVSMLDLLRQEIDVMGIRQVWLSGSTRNRKEVVNAFQEDDDVRVFLISLKAGGTGLNLTAAEYVYLVDPWWNPAAENQAIDRTHRIGQDKKVVAVRLITPNTVEEKIAVLQETKSVLAGGLVQADDSFFKSLEKEDLMGLLHPL